MRSKKRIETLEARLRMLNKSVVFLEEKLALCEKQLESRIRVIVRQRQLMNVMNDSLGKAEAQASGDWQENVPPAPAEDRSGGSYGV